MRLQPLLKGLAVPLMAATSLATMSSLPIPAQAEPFSLGTTRAAQAPTSLADVVEPLLPAVVNISTTQKVKMRMPGMESMLPDDIPPGSPLEDLRDFFEQFYGTMPQPGMGGEQFLNPDVTSLGSGFIIDASGYIVTNNHVIADADEITVRMHDEREFRAEIVGRDAKTDLALLKIAAPDPLPFVSFGDSTRARVGDWVIAVGNPFGLGGTVTAGIISARARDINAGPFDDFIQTDAAINSGNSGGPMFNLSGEIIGVNTAIFTPSGGNVGIGFATPAALAKPVIEQLKAHRRVRWGWLGVKIQKVTADIAESLGRGGNEGALVAEITPGAPAAKSNLKVGDLILGFDGQPVKEMRDFPRMVAQTEVGRDVVLDVWRDGKSQKIKVSIGESPDTITPEALKPSDSSSDKPENPGRRSREVLGMQLGKPDAALRQEFGLESSIKGLVVMSVQPQSPAWQQGVRVGDVLTKLNEEPLASPDDLVEKLDAAAARGRKYALLRLYRQGETHFITLPTGAEE
jgi:serine protease Do